MHLPELEFAAICKKVLYKVASQILRLPNPLVSWGTFSDNSAVIAGTRKRTASTDKLDQYDQQNGPQV